MRIPSRKKKGLIKIIAAILLIYGMSAMMQFTAPNWFTGPTTVFMGISAVGLFFSAVTWDL